MSEFGISQFRPISPAPLKESFVSPEPTEAKSSGQSANSQSFMETLEGVLNETNKSIKGADKAAADLAAGRADNLHNVMIAMEKADLSLRTMNAIRNKTVEAYQEIMRMQV